MFLIRVNHIQCVADLRQALEAVSRRPAQKLEVSKLNRRMDALQRELEKARELKDALYRRYAMGEVDLEDFKEFKRIFEQDCQKAEQAMDAQRAQLDAILENKTQVRNTKAYLLAALFDAPATKENHYAMAANSA